MSDFDHAIQQARKLSGTPEGKQLAALLHQLGGCDVQQALDNAAAGDPRQAKQLLLKLLQDPQAAALLKQLGGTNGN